MVVASLLLLCPDWTRWIPLWGWPVLGALAAPTYLEAALLLVVGPLWAAAGARTRPWGAFLLVPGILLALVAVWPLVFKTIGAVPLLLASGLALLAGAVARLRRRPARRRLARPVLPSPYCSEGRGRLCAGPHDLALLLGLP